MIIYDYLILKSTHKPKAFTVVVVVVVESADGWKTHPMIFDNTLQGRSSKRKRERPCSSSSLFRLHLSSFSYSLWSGHPMLYGIALLLRRPKDCSIYSPQI